MKTYIVTKEQIDALVETKKKRNGIIKSICEEMDKKIKFLHEGKQLNDAVTDTLLKYRKRGLLDDKIFTKIKEIYSPR